MHSLVPRLSAVCAYIYSVIFAPEDYCVLSQAGQCAIIDAVWTEVLHQLLVASADLRDEVLYTPWSCILYMQYCDRTHATSHSVCTV